MREQIEVDYEQATEIDHAAFDERLPLPEPTGVEADELSGCLMGCTSRRSFIRGVAAAGASTAAAVALERAAVVDLFAEQAIAQSRRTNPFSRFRAIAPSSADVLQVPSGFRSQVLLEWGDTFRGRNGRRLRFGSHCDFLAFMPLRGSREGLLFVNHEYLDPFFVHGYQYADGSPPKTPDRIALEQQQVGNSIVHIRRSSSGTWRVVQGSRYNRRITGASPKIAFTGPLKGAPGIGDLASGSVANCSGGITPWGTVLSCEENFQDYGPLSADGYGWGGEHDHVAFAKYGWVVEHDPYRPTSRPRKHTALGRFRHENTAFRHQRGKKFVLYMGDDARNEGVYKFVSDREYRSGNRSGNRRILEAGTLYVARWEPEGRRRFNAAGETAPVTATSGTGRWVEVRDDELVDTAKKLRARLGADEWDLHFATNRPEDLEVRGGSVYIALTNNSTVKDSFGSIRVLRDAGNDPEALEFTWVDYAAGGPSGRSGRGEGGFASPDNLIFDRAGNLWVLTDNSASVLNKENEYKFHGNNAVFMIPTNGANRGVAFRFANLPIDAEGTGPWFTPDERSFFMAVQHPGEQSSGVDGAALSKPELFTSWWPRGNKTANRRPRIPRSSVVVISKR